LEIFIIALYHYQEMQCGLGDSGVQITLATEYASHKVMRYPAEYIMLDRKVFLEPLTKMLLLWEAESSE
jgi:hypothetical protein